MKSHAAEKTHSEAAQPTQQNQLLALLAAATEAGDLGIWDWDLVTGKLASIMTLTTLFKGADLGGVTHAEHFIERILHPEDRESFLQTMRTAVSEQGEDRLQIRFRYLRVDGSVQHVQLHGRIVRNNLGVAQQLLGLSRNITEQIAAEALIARQAQQQSMLLERLNLATETAGIDVWDWDLHNDRLIAGAYVASADDLTADDLPKGRELISRVLHPEDLTGYLAAIDKAITSGSTLFHRHRILRDDGSLHHLQVKARVLRDANGKAVRLLGISQNKTDEVEHLAELRRQAAEERALRDRLDLATQTARISVWDQDLITGGFAADSRFWELFGLDGCDVNYRVQYGIHPDVRTQTLEPIYAAFADPKQTRISIRHRTSNPKRDVQYVQTHIRVFRDDDGRAARLLGVTWDVTEEVQATERLQRQAESDRMWLDRMGIATEAAGISAWEFDLKYDRFTWHSNRQAIFGLGDAPLETLHISLRKIVHPDDLAIYRYGPVEAIARGEESYRMCFRIFGNDGQIYYLQTAARIIKGISGRPRRLVGVTWDTTKEILHAEALQQAAEHERALVERLNVSTQAAGISPWEFDLNSYRFSWHGPRLEFFGLDDVPLEDYFAAMQKLVMPEDRDAFTDSPRQAAQSNLPSYQHAFRVNGSDGQIHHIQNHGRVMRNKSGRARYIVGVTWDVSKEVAASQLLKEQADQLRVVERRLERASLSSSEGHWEAELASGLFWCSSSFHALLGYREGELAGRVSVLDTLVHADDHAVYHQALSAHLTDNAPYDTELRMRTGSGEYRWFRMRGMAERDAQGQAMLMAGSIHDIHQQRSIEDALKLAQRRFERAINGTQDGLWELDVANDTTWCSPRLALLLGYPVTQLATGNFLRSLLHPEDAPKIVAISIAHYRDNTPFDIEARFRTRLGGYRWYRARATAERDSNGRALHLSGSLQDVTEARAAREDLMRATEAAEAASRAKSSFLANVSHEIRTPMNGIIGMTGLLIETSLDRTQREYADTIRSSADSLLTVINDILDFSKIEAGKLDLESIELDLRANVEDVGAMLAFQAASKGLELIVNVHPEISEHVLGDPQRLRQCLVNLVGNAIKFTQRGEIVIDVCVVGRHEGRLLTHFEVRDTGMGIAQDTLKTLFQPFVQADSSTTRHFGGTGLGLSIVRRLVELMGGQVGVVSEVGKGSTFFFTLSLEPIETETVPRENDITRHGNILIVDDNTTNQRVLSSQLLHAGYEVTTAGSGSQALDLLLAAIRTPQPFDMVITDFQMPDMDGMMLGERIIDVASLANTRLVMLTSLDRQDDTPRLAALGFAAYLIKPVRVRELLDCVARVLSGEARQWQMEIRPMITRNSLSQAKTQQRFVGHVLLVEDNVVNQKVAMRFLERMGCTVAVADHGADGVAACRQSNFDLVLMDLQMPVMDGLTATRKIRELETGGRRTPIIALTANAMRGDQARCETAGMDGFLTKPIEVERLRDVLAKFGLSVQSIAAPALANTVLNPASTPTTQFAAPVDLARINEITGGDVDFAQELATTFTTSGEQQLLEIDAAIGLNDRAALARAAHKLKGACANIHAHNLRALALRLETESGAANHIALQACSTELKQEFERVRLFLSDPVVMGDG